MGVREANFVARLAAFGIAWPGAPQYDNIVEGPFHGFHTMSNTDEADVDLLAANGPFASDRKLFVNGFNNSGAAHPTGVLIFGGVSQRGDPDINPGSEVIGLDAAYNLVHSPQGNTREKVIGFNDFTAYPVGQSVAAGPLVRVGGQVPQPQYSTPGGPWVVNCQSDTLVLRIAQILVGVGITLTADIDMIISLDPAAFIPQAVAQDMGILDPRGVMLSGGYDKIMKALSQRKAWGTLRGRRQ